MNDILKDSIRRALKMIGVRLSKERYYKSEYDPKNYLEVGKHPQPVIFDVGANIGQSALWFSKSFPHAGIHAFEPVPSVFRRLQKQIAGNANIQALNLACGRVEKIVHIPSNTSDSIQTLQVLSEQLVQSEGDEVMVTTVDKYCEQNGIHSIQILKTDTEGYDLDVLAGAAGMLRAGNIDYVLSEATIFELDTQHTQFFALNELLGSFGYKLYSFYSIHHDPENGRTEYFNALFRKG